MTALSQKKCKYCRELLPKRKKCEKCNLTMINLLQCEVCHNEKKHGVITIQNARIGAGSIPVGSARHDPDAYKRADKD